MMNNVYQGLLEDRTLRLAIMNNVYQGLLQPPRARLLSALRDSLKHKFKQLIQ